MSLNPWVSKEKTEELQEQSQLQLLRGVRGLPLNRIIHASTSIANTENRSVTSSEGVIGPALEITPNGITVFQSVEAATEYIQEFGPVKAIAMTEADFVVALRPRGVGGLEREEFHLKDDDERGEYMLAAEAWAYGLSMEQIYDLGGRAAGYIRPEVDVIVPEDFLDEGKIFSSPLQAAMGGSEIVYAPAEAFEGLSTLTPGEFSIEEVMSGKYHLAADMPVTADEAIRLAGDDPMRAASLVASGEIMARARAQRGSAEAKGEGRPRYADAYEMLGKYGFDHQAEYLEVDMVHGAWQAAYFNAQGNDERGAIVVTGGNLDEAVGAADGEPLWLSGGDARDLDDCYDFPDHMEDFLSTWSERNWAEFSPGKQGEKERQFEFARNGLAAYRQLNGIAAHDAAAAEQPQENRAAEPPATERTKGGVFERLNSFLRPVEYTASASRAAVQSSGDEAPRPRSVKQRIAVDMGDAADEARGSIDEDEFHARAQAQEIGLRQRQEQAREQGRSQ